MSATRKLRNSHENHFFQPGGGCLYPPNLRSQTSLSIVSPLQFRLHAILWIFENLTGEAVSRRHAMAQRRQRGWLKKENRIQGETWVLYFRTTRKSDGRRVENKIPIGLLRDLPDKRTAWAEVERLHLPINPVDSRRSVTGVRCLSACT